MTHTMKCSEVQSRLSAYQDNELHEALAENIRLHIESCSACAHELELLDAVADTVRALPQDEPAANFTALVMGRIQESEQKRQFKYIPSFVYSLVVILCFGLGILLQAVAYNPTSGQNGTQIAHDSLTQLMEQSQTLSLSHVHESSLEILIGPEGSQR